MGKEQTSTRILHHDRRQGTEAGAVHQPIHVSAEFAYAQEQDLIDVFQGKPGFTYTRKATHSTARLEILLIEIMGSVGYICFYSVMVPICADVLELFTYDE